VDSHRSAAYDQRGGTDALWLSETGLRKIVEKRVEHLAMPGV